MPVTLMPQPVAEGNLEFLLDLVRKAHPGKEPDVWTINRATLVVAAGTGKDQVVYSLDHVDPTTKRLPPPVGTGDADVIAQRYATAIT